MDFGTTLERGGFTARASRRDGCFNPKCLLAEPAANGKPATYSHTRQRPSWSKAGSCVGDGLLCVRLTQFALCLNDCASDACFRLSSTFRQPLFELTGSASHRTT